MVGGGKRGREREGERGGGGRQVIGICKSR